MDIKVEELKKRMDNKENLVIIDVREPHEYSEFNIGGKNIPLGTLPVMLPELEEFKASEIIVHCRSGKRSATAQAILQQSGFQNVRNLIGGMMEWQDKFVKK